MAAAMPTDLFVGEKGARDEAFAFDRTASRLIEMGSIAYLTKAPQRAPAPVTLDEGHFKAEVGSDYF